MRIEILMLAGVLAGAAPAAYAGTEYVDALVWDTARQPGLFPEQAPGAPAPEGWSQESFGVAFSGGGTRAATATLGQLRALVALGWYQRLRYVSSVSGGTWGSLPFTYLPAAYSDKDYLGPVIPPQQLRDADFFGEPPPHSAAWAISNARLVPAAIDALTSGQGDESYSAAVARAFLRPFGLDDTHRGFAWSAEHARQIAARNALCFDKPKRDASQAPPRRPCAASELPGAVLRADDFYLPRAGRPFHIANGSLLAERSYGRLELAADSKFPLQVTPYYTGVARAETYRFKSVTSQLHVGGALVESFAFDTWPPLPVARADAGPAGAPAALYRAAWRRDRDRFTLHDVVGVTGAAPQQFTSAYGWRNLGLPEFQHWGMHPANHAVDRPFLHEFAHGDGGHVDNLGLGALLERGVRNIIVFANVLHSFSPGDAKLGRWPLKYSPLVDSLAAYFDKTGLAHGRNYLLTGIAAGRKADCPDPNAGPACALEDLRRAFARKQEHEPHEPLVHCQAYQVNAANARFNMAQWKEPAHICWVYLDRNGSRNWLDSLAPELSPRLLADLRQHENDFKHFPNYSTFFEDWELHEPIQLKAAQVAAMSQLTSWTVCASAGQIAREFAQLQLPAKGCPGIAPGP